MPSPRTRPRHCPLCEERLRPHSRRCLICRPPELSSFEGRLLYALLRSGMLQTEAADRIGIDTGYMSSMLAGKRNPTIFIVQCAAEALSVDPGWLAFGAQPAKFAGFTLPCRCGISGDEEKEIKP